MTIFFLTSIALVAFAANSVLCRIAFQGGSIDPISFTSIRLVAGALVLICITRLTREGGKKPSLVKSWRSGLALFTYAISFSLAYLSLTAGTGALLLFGAVQLTMIITALRSGEQMSGGQWIGSSIAIIGLVYLLLPGISTPSPKGAMLMVLSGIAWAAYTIAGKGVTTPIAMNAGNFLWAAAMSLIVSILTFSQTSFETKGLLLAVISGGLTSGIGYAIWYKVLPSLSTTQASMLQLLVPPLATIGGVLFITEPFTARIAISSVLILGGVGLTVLIKTRTKKHLAAARKRGPC